ncbi:MAG TPA: SprT family zinc-dependent metalloprotease [Candidatus Kapabacteria bacterium]|nr:SprT family zinc-dependent metalloprotease [Candidatus Kapabacteria bacterium]
MLPLFPQLESFTLHRRRVKYARIYINYDLEVRVVIPMRFPERALNAFLIEKAGWIEKTIAHYKHLRSQAPQLPKGEILFLGRSITVDFDTTNSVALEKWYRKEAKKYFSTRLLDLATQFGFSYNKLLIRGAKTRWGSCSSKKHISLNYHLIKAPVFAIEYVMLHELVHTEIMNHSKRFWKRVAEVCPGYKEATKWLRTYGNGLY